MTRGRTPPSAARRARRTEAHRRRSARHVAEAIGADHPALDAVVAQVAELRVAARDGSRRLSTWESATAARMVAALGATSGTWSGRLADLDANAEQVARLLSRLAEHGSLTVEHRVDGTTAVAYRPPSVRTRTPASRARDRNAARWERRRTEDRQVLPVDEVEVLAARQAGRALVPVAGGVRPLSDRERTLAVEVARRAGCSAGTVEVELPDLAGALGLASLDALAVLYRLDQAGLLTVETLTGERVVVTYRPPPVPGRPAAPITRSDPGGPP